MRVYTRAGIATILVALTAGPVAADISGWVRDLDTAAAIAGAAVHLQADPDSPVVLSGADGAFTLPVSPAGVVTVTASVTYDHGATSNWTTGGTFAVDGNNAVEILLRSLPAAENPIYESELPLVDSCESCHHDYVNQWSASVHAGAGDDEWVLDLLAGTGTPGGGAGYVFRDLHEPDETGFCATCHNPMADVFDPGNVFMDEVAGTAALEGVSCIACHQMDHVNSNVAGLHHLGNGSYRFPDGGGFPTHQYVWGPLDDISFTGMRASHQPLFDEALFCASCHEYNNPDTGAPGQTTFTEWLASPYSSAGPSYRSCQDCHMPAADEDGAIANVGGDVTRPADQRHSHEMVGSTAETLADAVTLTTAVDETGNLLRVRCDVDNHGAGHAFPAGVSVRNALLVIEASADGGPLAQVSGPTVPFWADDDVPGWQDGDYAGAPGSGFAKVLEGRINGQGEVVRPVLFIDAEGVWADTAIPAGETDVTVVDFALPEDAQPGDMVEVRARLLYRRAWRALAVTKGWAQTPQGGPIELEVAETIDMVQLTAAGAVPAIPTMGVVGYFVLGSALAAAAVFFLRRRA